MLDRALAHPRRPTRPSRSSRSTAATSATRPRSSRRSSSAGRSSRCTRRTPPSAAGRSSSRTSSTSSSGRRSACSVWHVLRTDRERMEELALRDDPGARCATAVRAAASPRASAPPTCGCASGSRRRRGRGGQGQGGRGARPARGRARRDRRRVPGRRLVLGRRPDRGVAPLSDRQPARGPADHARTATPELEEFFGPLRERPGGRWIERDVRPPPQPGSRAGRRSDG